MHFQSPLADLWDSSFMDENDCSASTSEDSSEKCDANNWYKELQDIVNPGDVIYEVYGLVEPIYSDDTEAQIAAKTIKLGDIVMESDLIISEFADTKLYFQHRQITRDRKFWQHPWPSSGGRSDDLPSATSKTDGTR